LFILALVLAIVPEVALSKNSSKIHDKQGHLLIIKLIILFMARFFILGLLNFFLFALGA